MKRFLLCLYVLAIALNSFATAQEGDVIFIDGEKWCLMWKPIYADSKIADKLLSVLPEKRETSTANWDGYTGYWSIKDKELFLDSIVVFVYNNGSQESKRQCISPTDMYSVFGKYYKKNNIVASWFSNKVRAGQGKVIMYQHDAYERNYEKEQILTIENGKVIKQQSFQNRIVVDGFSYNDLNGKGKIREKLPLHLDTYPELDGLKRIVFTIKDVRLDSAGNLIDCNVSTLVPKQKELSEATKKKLAEEMEKNLKSIHPWKTYLINGEYTTEYRDSFTIPYLLSE